MKTIPSLGGGFTARPHVFIIVGFRIVSTRQEERMHPRERAKRYENHDVICTVCKHIIKRSKTIRVKDMIVCIKCHNRRKK